MENTSTTTPDLCATWEALEACKDAGLVKSLGVSNFNRRQLELLLNKPGLKHRPVSNQVNAIHISHSPSFWSTVGNVKCPPLLEDELLVSIGKKYKKSTAQVALRFTRHQRGVVVIPKSFSPRGSNTLSRYLTFHSLRKK
ncbi:hypothetical protein KUCAC02_021363 [Chaenocephalus aceratus]|uniref:Uncharacterized protein n=1 Tax=Chaenocephalus aceratus TaxID=36190 RepID=A0ACB9XF95_CHAAC|nr:hypothetical protein KUCAC02_021363 [Chaenocephalus aceratus]